MMNPKLSLSAVAVATLFCGAAFAQEDRHAETRRLLDLAGTKKTLETVLPQMMASMRKIAPQVPDEFWAEFQKECDTETLIAMVIPIYEKHFSADEVKQLITFYQSPVGKKLSQEQPMIMQESMLAGQKWGQKVGERLGQKLKEKGYGPKGT